MALLILVVLVGVALAVADLCAYVAGGRVFFLGGGDAAEGCVVRGGGGDEVGGSGGGGGVFLRLGDEDVGSSNGDGESSGSGLLGLNIGGIGIVVSVYSF